MEQIPTPPLESAESWESLFAYYQELREMRGSLRSAIDEKLGKEEGHKWFFPKWQAFLKKMNESIDPDELESYISPHVLVSSGVDESCEEIRRKELPGDLSVRSFYQQTLKELEEIK